MTQRFVSFNRDLELSWIPNPKTRSAAVFLWGPRRKLVVSRVATPRRTEDGIEILPWDQFCKELWAGELIRCG
jgi:hypothetical protein